MHPPTPPPTPGPHVFRFTVDIETHDTDGPRLTDQIGAALMGSDAVQMATQVWVGYPRINRAGVGSEKVRPKRSDYRKMLGRLIRLVQFENEVSFDEFSNAVREAKRLMQK